MLRAVTSLAAPPLCTLCGGPCDYRDSICSRCDRGLARLPPMRTVLPGGLEVISAAPYDGLARDLVTKMKFAARLTLAEVAAERMVRAWGATRRGDLVPVPAAPARARARGYDPAHTLARLIQDRTWAQLVVDLVRADGPRQVGRPRAERVAHPPRIARVRSDVRLAGTVWLVDDVVTTGATLTACAAVLRKAGAERVRALTFAKAVDQPPEPRRSPASSFGLRRTGLGSKARAA